MALPAIYDAAPGFTPRTAHEAQKLARCYEKGIGLFTDHHYLAVALLHDGKPTGVFKVGLHPDLQLRVMQQEAQEAGMTFEAYEASLRERGHKPTGGPYLVNILTPSCDCPSFPAYYEGKYCKHILGLQWALTYPHTIGKSGRVLFHTQTEAT